MYEHGDRVRLKRACGYGGCIGDLCTALRVNGSWLFDVTDTAMESQGWFGHRQYEECKEGRRYLWLDKEDFELCPIVFLGGE